MAGKAKGQRGAALTPPTTTTPTAATSVPDSSQATDNGLPSTRGLVYGPHPGRRGNLILVRHCPRCTASHRHVSEVLAQRYVRLCPVTGSSYEIEGVVERDTAKAVRYAA